MSRRAELAEKTNRGIPCVQRKSDVWGEEEQESRRRREHVSEETPRRSIKSIAIERVIYDRLGLGVRARSILGEIKASVNLIN